MQIQQAPYINGTIYLVGVPIGDIDDISYKAVKVLKSCSVIFAEDTRRAHKLLNDLDIKDKKVYAHHEHNEKESAKGIIDLVSQGNDVAFISDAGMPGIADPGFVLAKQAIENNINVVPISGPCAGILGLVGSGLSTSSFVFIGFLPRTQSQIIKKLEDYKNSQDTLIFYESPRRVLETLKIVKQVYGNRNICLARELTKIYEEYIRGTVDECINELESREKVLGEFCIIVDKANKQDLIADDETIMADIKAMLAENYSAKDIKEQLAIKYNIKKKRVYQLYLKII